MKFIIGSRGSGVTTDILLEASKFDRPIIVPTEANKRHIVNNPIKKSKKQVTEQLKLLKD